MWVNSLQVSVKYIINSFFQVFGSSTCISLVLLNTVCMLVVQWNSSLCVILEYHNRKLNASWNNEKQTLLLAHVMNSLQEMMGIVIPHNAACSICFVIVYLSFMIYWPKRFRWLVLLKNYGNSIDIGKPFVNNHTEAQNTVQRSILHGH